MYELRLQVYKVCILYMGLFCSCMYLSYQSTRFLDSVAYLRGLVDRIRILYVAYFSISSFLLMMEKGNTIPTRSTLWAWGAV
jgi:hypothetical protein